MSVNEFLIILTEYDYFILCFFSALPILSYVTGFFYQRSGRSVGIKTIYSVLIYLSVIPGTMAFLLIFYTMFFIRRNILDLNFYLYFLPLISMGLVLYIISRKVKFENLPGFGRLSGLLLLIGIVCLITLVLYRLHFFIGFFASIQSLIIAGIIIFFLFRYAAGKINGK